MRPPDWQSGWVASLFLATLFNNKSGLEAASATLRHGSGSWPVVHHLFSFLHCVTGCCYVFADGAGLIGCAPVTASAASHAGRLAAFVTAGRTSHNPVIASSLP